MMIPGKNREFKPELITFNERNIKRKVAIRSQFRSGNEVTSISQDDPDGYPTYMRIMTIHKAKGLQFPIVILPEVQEDLKKEYIEPDLLITESQGVEIDLKLPGVNMFSSHYHQNLDQNRRSSLEEEMRLFYVAPTRAEQAVITIGSGRMTVNRLNSKSYCWKDEILKARQELESGGGKFFENFR